MAANFLRSSMKVSPYLILTLYITHGLINLIYINVEVRSVMILLVQIDFEPYPQQRHIRDKVSVWTKPGAISARLKAEG